MKKRNERKGGNDFSFSYQSEFAFLSQTFESWRLGHVRRTSDRASACTQAPRMFYRPVNCFLSGCTLFIWLVSNSCYFYSFFIFTILIFLQSWIWYSFCQSFFFQCLASLFHVILVYPSVWATIKHFRQNRTKSRSAPYVAFDRYCEAAVTSDFRTTFVFPLFLGCQRMRVTWFE